MKLYNSADMEGVAGIVNWQEANIESSFSKYFCEQMTKEVNEACEAAQKLNPHIMTVDVSEGIGNASISIHPDLAIKTIKQKVPKVIGDDLSKNLI